MNYLPYSQYKQSWRDWLGEVPDHWEVLSIKRLTPVSRGASPRPIEDPKYFDEEGEYAWVRIADVTSNHHYLRETTQRLSDLGKSFSVALEPGSLFLSIAGSVGKPMITAIKACIHDGFVYFPQLKINFEFLYYIFESGQPYLGLGKFGTQLNLNTDTVGGIKIGLPPREEQDAIAEFLDWKTGQIDALIEKKKELLEKLTEKRIAVITQAITQGLNPAAPMRDSGIPWLGQVPEHWEVKRLRRFVDEIEQGWSPQCDNAAASLDEWGVVKAGCCNGGRFNPDENKGLPPELDAPESLEIKGGELLMSRASGSEELIGSAALVPLGTRDKLLLSDKTYRLRCDEKAVQPAFLAHALQSPVGRYQIQAAISGAFGLARNIAQSDVKDLVFAIPPITEQVAITQVLDHATGELDSLAAKVESAIDRLTEYRTALITAATTGKIDVRQVKIPQPGA